METDWAAEQLQTIRTLMERSAVYRRALGPIMLFAGTLGTLSAIAGLVFHLETMRAFLALWFLTAGIVVAGAFVIARRQALKDNEPFWSPPTRRVAQALAPPLTAGLILGTVLVKVGLSNALVVTFIWLLFYGCALNAAGFFMPRGMRLFGWLYIGLACASLLTLALTADTVEISAHWLMGFFFGIMHLGYGAYLMLTEKRKQAE